MIWGIPEVVLITTKGRSQRVLSKLLRVYPYHTIYHVLTGSLIKGCLHFRAVLTVTLIKSGTAHHFIWRHCSASILGTTRTDTRAPMLMYWAGLSRIASPRERRSK